MERYCSNLPEKIRIKGLDMASKELNSRLTAFDASFLYCEKPIQPTHIGGGMTYEGHISRDEVIRVLTERMPLLPRYRQKVVFSPYRIAHPTWEDDASFNVHHHVEEITLPAPGDKRVLSEIGGQVYAAMLDRDRPLWTVILCHGYTNGNTVLIWKIHHAMVDGVSSVELITATHDLKPKTEVSNTEVQWQPRPAPDRLTRMRHAVRERLTETVQWWTDEVFGLLDSTRIKERWRQTAKTVSSLLPTLYQSAPQAPFNGQLSGRRQFAWVEFSFAEIRAIRSLLGGTVNDVVLAVIAGGLGQYLRAHGTSTQDMELRAMCPVSLRREDEHGALGNRVSLMIAPLYVGITDPVQRLIAERTAMKRLKEQDQAGGFSAMTDLGSRLSPLLQEVAGQWSPPNFLLNTVSTNIPGPQIPLYFGGHKLLSWCPLGITAANIGLFNAILSYDQKLTISATVDPKLVPDPWFYTECLQKSFKELLAAAEQSAATPPSTPPPEPPPRQSLKRRRKPRERKKAA